MSNLILDCLEEKGEQISLIGTFHGRNDSSRNGYKKREQISKLICYSTGPIGEMQKIRNSI